jgi:hypothetical protein
MPDYADNYTARYKMSYTCGGMGHTQTWRMGTAATVGAAAAAIANIQSLWLVAGPFMASDLAFSGAVFYPVNSDIALPADLPPGMGDVESSGSADLSAGPKYMSIPWQTGIGGKQTTFFYGTNWDPDEVAGSNYRFEFGEDAGLDALIVAMASTVILMTGNDRSPGYGPKQYVNFGVNPALVRKRRRG